MERVRETASGRNTAEREEKRIRAFLAVPVPEEVLGEAQRLQGELAAPLRGVRWVRPEGIHLTLKFFGAVTEETLETIGEVMLSVSTLHAPFEVRVAGLGAFPSPNRPRVIWLGLRDEVNLRILHQELETALEQVGIPAEGRPFHPHLTLGRARGRMPPIQGILEPYRDLSCGTVPVHELVLYESRLQPAGARYFRLKTVRLGS